MIITREQLLAIMPNAIKRVDAFLEPINKTLEKYELNTPVRVQMFLAQLAHESGELRYVREIASGKAYEGRKDLGNTTPGDGVKYKGRGLIQLTGKANYAQLSKAFEYDFVADPLKLEDPLYASLSAGWYWDSRKLNAWADKGDFLKVTKIINGGTNGLEDRKKYWERAKKVIA